MTHKKPKNTEEQEKLKQKRNDLTDFYELIDTLLPQKNELLRDTLEKMKKETQDTLAKNENESDYLLELEKAKNSYLQVLLKIFIEQYQRASADYINYQKRISRQIADTISYEKEQIIKSLLPALDNFEHTIQKAHSAETAEDIIKGVKIIYDQICDILKSHGIEQIKSVGEKFDPALHQAMMQKSEPEKEENIILEEFQPGYKLNGKVIRPGRVIVNKPSAEPQQQPASQEKKEENKKERAE